MKILITGANGQLGNEIRVEATKYSNVEFIFTDVSELDICDITAFESFVINNNPDFIVNCAAYTAVDKAEDNQANAIKVNVEAVENIGKIGAKYNAMVLHVSTDYVFDGTNYKPYNENDVTSPAGIYGKTKLDGEIALQNVCRNSIIIRTAWLYSSFGNNFVKTMIKLGAEREKLTVIFDQVGSPTYANDLAQAICTIIMSGKWESGVYHYSNEGVCSWYDFAIECHRMAKIQNCKVLPIESFEYPVRTPRPHYSVLNKRKIKNTYSIEIPHWKQSLEKCIEILMRGV